MVAALTGGCTGSAPEERKAESPPTRTAATRTVTGFDPPAGALTTGRRVRVGSLPDSLDLADALDAPTLAERPIDRSILLAQVSLFSRDPLADALGRGSVYLLSQRGEWRRVRLDDYGFARSYGEMGVALSDDGRRIALNDNYRQVIVVVDVASGRFVRHKVPAPVAITLKWTPDGRRLLFSDRRRDLPGWSLDVRTGAVKETPYGVWFWEDDPAGRVVDLTDAGRLRTWRGDRQVHSATLAYPDLGGAYPIAAGELLAVRQDRSRVGGRRAPRGVAVFQPRSGDLVAFLDLGSQIGWTGPLVWPDARTLLMHDGKSGKMRLWDILAARLSPVTRVANHGGDAMLAVDALRDAADQG